MAKAKPVYYRCKEPFVATIDGDQIGVAYGEIVRAGHSIMKRREDHFEPVTSFGRFDVQADEPAEPDDPPVEKATAAPGEKRGAPKK